jgi:WhiB family redox-sensing transcriptional regulator
MPSNTTDTDGNRGNSKYTYMELLAEWSLTDKGVDWKDDAACRGMDGTIFFAGDNNHYDHRAIPTCQTCTVKERCLEFAINNNINYGIWGGMTPPERQRKQKGIQ